MARSEDWDERLPMMQLWSDYLEILWDGGNLLQCHLGKSEAVI